MENAVELSVPLSVKVSVGYDWANLKLLDENHDTSEWKQQKRTIPASSHSRMQLRDRMCAHLNAAAVKCSECIVCESRGLPQSTERDYSLIEKLLMARSREAVIIDARQSPNDDLKNVARTIFGALTPS